jgi:YD repeat-containing protein
MTRRHWFARLLAALLSGWGAARARAVPRPPSRAPKPRWGWPAPAAPLGTTTSYFYDASNRLVAVRYDSGPLTTYVYDGLGRPGSGA